jgi:hypothetical protein
VNSAFLPARLNQKQESEQVVLNQNFTNEEIEY